MLIIDGEKLVREILAEIMDQVGVASMTTADGQEGIELYRKHADSIGLIYLDYILPATNGEKIFYELRKINPAAKIILSSCYIHPATAYRLQAENNVELLPKPFDIRAFLHKVQKVFGKDEISSAHPIYSAAPQT
jgi:DNA-binding NtrC family response regulator